MSISASVVGNLKTLAFLQAKKGQVSKEKDVSLKKAALFLQGEIKESIAGRRAEKTSVDTGRFLNSVDIVIGKDEAFVFSDVEYAKFLEFGTIRFTGRKHFNNSKDRNKSKIKKIFEDQIKNI